MHSVFEGHRLQTPQKLRRWIKKSGIQFPVAVDPEDGKRPRTYETWNAGGTPTLAIIDKLGIIRYFALGGIDPKEGDKLLEQLLRESESDTRKAHQRILADRKKKLDEIYNPRKEAQGKGDKSKKKS